MKKDATGIIEGRVDICSLATLYNFFESNGVHISTKSALLNEIVETLKVSLIENSMVVPVTMYEEASEMLEKLSTRRDVKVRGGLGRAITAQRQTELSQTEMRNAAMDWLKKNDPMRYEELSRSTAMTSTIENDSDNSDINSDIQLSKEAMVVPDLSILPKTVEEGGK